MWSIFNLPQLKVWVVPSNISGKTIPLVHANSWSKEQSFSQRGCIHYVYVFMSATDFFASEFTDSYKLVWV